MLGTWTSIWITVFVNVAHPTDVTLHSSTKNGVFTATQDPQGVGDPKHRPLWPVHATCQAGTRDALMSMPGIQTARPSLITGQGQQPYHHPGWDVLLELSAKDPLRNINECFS